MASDKISVLGGTNFKEFIDSANMPVLVDFWAEWCGPCKMIAPVVEEIAADYDGKIKVAKFNVDEDKSVPSSFGIVSIPTLVVFKGGQEVERIVGFRTKKELQAILDKHL